MKLRTQHDLIDPNVTPPALEFEFEEGNEAELPDDAYVMGENGEIVAPTSTAIGEEAIKGPSPWVKPAAIVLTCLFAILTVWNISRFVEGPPAPPKPTPFQAKQALYLGVMKIDAFRRVNGKLPETLTEAGLPEASVYAYQTLGPTRYVLSFRQDGSKLEYDSNEPKEKFFGPAKDVLKMGGSR